MSNREVELENLRSTFLTLCPLFLSDLNTYALSIKFHTTTSISTLTPPLSYPSTLQVSSPQNLSGSLQALLNLGQFHSRLFFFFIYPSPISLLSLPKYALLLLLLAYPTNSSHQNCQQGSPWLRSVTAYFSYFPVCLANTTKPPGTTYWPFLPGNSVQSSPLSQSEFHVVPKSRVIEKNIFKAQKDATYKFYN